MRRDVLGGDLQDVPRNRMVRPEVCAVGNLAMCVPLAREHALAAGSLEPSPHAAYSREEIDERESGVGGPWCAPLLEETPETLDHCTARRALSTLPAVDRLETITGLVGEVALR